MAEKSLCLLKEIKNGQGDNPPHRLILKKLGEEKSLSIFGGGITPIKPIQQKSLSFFFLFERK